MTLKFVAFLGALLLLVAGVFTPSLAATESGDSPQTWIQCDNAILASCPEPPEISAITSAQTSLQVSWTWGQDTPTPSDITDLVLRVAPGDIQVVIPMESRGTEITGLEPNTEYTLTAQSAAGNGHFICE